MVAPRHHMDFQSRRSLMHGPVLCYSVDHVQWHAVPLTRNEVVVGRDGDCDLPLEHTSVSRFHARISLSLTTDQVEDLQSRNGCFVDGKRSAEFKLGDGETFRIGQVFFLFTRAPGTARLPDGRRVAYLPVRELSPRRAAADPEEKTMLFAKGTTALRPDMMKRLLQGDANWASGALVSETDRQRWRLGLKEHRFGWRTEIEVGGWAFGGWTGSGHGAVVSWDKDGHVIRTTAMFASVRVNGRDVNKRKLRHGDRVSVGGRRFRYLAA